MYPPGPETVTTYRYVRLSIIGVVVLLFAALAVAIARDDWAVGPSISAYYYGPVRSVLVGSLVAAAFLLVAVRGRPGSRTRCSTWAAWSSQSWPSSPHRS